MAYPHGKFRYIVELEGLELGGFSEVSGFDASIDVMEYREGDKVQTPMKIPGLKKYGNITLKQGVADKDALYKWMETGFEKDVNRQTVTITLLDINGEPAASWQVINAWPTKYTAPDFNATASEIAVETLELAHEGMTRTK
ncbi:MAG: phage tail protein [Bacteroides sp.]|nr:phage tail protein [Bacteroides sp.]MCM1548438.1 phage tail protein [Clostridium sp.]